MLNETEEENTIIAYAYDSLTPEAVPKVVFRNYTPDEAPFTSRLKIIKNDNFGNPLKGATFEVYTKAEPKTLMATADMSDTDTWTSDWLPRGEYSVYETVAPEGTNETLPKHIGDVELKGKTEEITVLTVINTLSTQVKPSEPEEPAKPEQPSEPGKPISPTKPSKPSGNGNSGSTAVLKPSIPTDLPNTKDDSVLTPELPIVHEPYPADSEPTEDNDYTTDENSNIDLPDDLSVQKENPRTGDNSPYFAWWTLLIASASLFVIVIIYRYQSMRKKT